MKRIFAALTACLSLCVLSLPSQAQLPDFDQVEIKTHSLGDGVYMLEGFGGNIGISVGDDGVFMIDDQFAPLSEKILAAVGAITDQQIEFLINTHWHFDHAGSNEQMANAGATILAHDNVRVRMQAPGPQQATDAALPVITFSDTTTVYFNDHQIHAFHPAAAHTDGDAIIHFVDLNLIHAGDVFFNGVFPFIDVSSGGSVEGYLDALRTLADLADDDTRIIPGHGPMATKSDVLRKIAMLEDARTRVLDLISSGASVDDAKAAQPLAAYAEEWTWEFINADTMVEMLYGALR